MSFHVVYSRHYWDYEDGNGSFDNSWTIYRNVPYSELFKMKDAIPTLLENADQVYADYESKKGYKIDQSQFIKSEVFICDDEEYYKTYSDVYDLHNTPYADSSYFHDYGQEHPFMLLKDFNQKQEATK